MDKYFWINLEASIHIQMLQFEQSGPTDEQIALALSSMELLFHPAVSAKIRQEKSHQEALDVLAWSLAVLSYIPGGVRFGPLHIVADVAAILTMEMEAIAA